MLTSKKNLMEAVPESSSLHKAKSMASNLDLEKPKKLITVDKNSDLKSNVFLTMTLLLGKS